jgi:hypothetical protein
MRGAWHKHTPEIKEQSYMSHLKKHPLSLALCLSLAILAPSWARAETISMTITLGGGATFMVDTVATASATGYTVDAGGLSIINAFLSANGSEYQFGSSAGSTTSLGGSSNFPGDSTQGRLSLTGEIHSIAGGGLNSVLTITETESDFTAPTGPTGMLKSSSTGNFANQPAGAGHMATSMFNALGPGMYAVDSNNIAPNPGGGTGEMPVAPVSTLYTLTNVIMFGLTPTSGNDVVDSFGVTATITAQSTVPEPASFVTVATGIPISIIAIQLLRRRRLAGRRRSPWS